MTTENSPLHKKEILHISTVAGVIEALELSFGKNLYADKVVEKLLRTNKKWGSRDRSFVAMHTYEMVRHWRKLWAVYGKEPSLKRKDLYNLFGIWWMMNGGNLPDWPKFDSIRELDVDAQLKLLPNDIAIQESFPQWLSDVATEELGHSWPTIAKGLNQKASVILRVNTLKTTRTALMQRLAQEGIEAIEMDNFADAIELQKRPKLTHLQSFKDGLFEVHDAGSQTIAPFLQPQPNDFVIDACAGAGGKTLQIAALMQNKGRIVAMDIEPYKLGELEKRAARNGAEIVETALANQPGVLDSYFEKADRLLLDVPCSGTGVIRRDVDTKWKLKPEHLERTMAIQRDILENYTAMLKPGGTLVYTTCSILKSENEYQKDWFIENYGDIFDFEEETRLNPGAENDGFYMARFVKK